MENTIVHRSSEPAKVECEQINILLRDKFGIDTVSGLPLWRVSWAPDQYEKKLGTYSDYTKSGIFIRTVTEVREVPKYPYLDRIYILENLQAIPVINAGELPTATLSYEGIYPFVHRITETYLPPKWEMCEFVIDCVYAAMGVKGLRKYVDPDAENPIEAKQKRVKEIYDYLYGDETKITDSLSNRTAIVVPTKYGDGNASN